MNSRLRPLDDTHAGLPPYRQIAADLRAKLRAGHWAAGAGLPSRRDLARDYRVTPNTINRAIQELVAEGVLRTTNRHGTFVTNPVPSIGPRATRPAVGHQPLVGIVANPFRDDAAHGWGPTVLHTIESACSALGAGTRLFRLPGAADNAMAATLSTALEAEIDALAVIYLESVPAWLDAFAAAQSTSRVPLLLVGTEAIAYPAPHTCVDEVAGGLMAATHLLQAGYRRLHALTPFASRPWLARRLEGVRLALRQAGLPSSTLRVQPATKRVTWEEWGSLLESGGAIGCVRPLLAPALEHLGTVGGGAIIAPNDSVAHAVLAVLRERGLTPGQDVGLIAFDDWPESAAAGLTSLRQPLTEMAETGARLLLAALAGQPLPTVIQLRPELIRRDSTRRQAVVPAVAT